MIATKEQISRRTIVSVIVLLVLAIGIILLVFQPDPCEVDKDVAVGKWKPDAQGISRVTDTDLSYPFGFEEELALIARLKKCGFDIKEIPGGIEIHWNTPRKTVP